MLSRIDPQRQDERAQVNQYEPRGRQLSSTSEPASQALSPSFSALLSNFERSSNTQHLQRAFYEGGFHTTQSISAEESTQTLTRRVSRSRTVMKRACSRPSEAQRNFARAIIPALPAELQDGTRVSAHLVESLESIAMIVTYDREENKVMSPAQGARAIVRNFLSDL